MILLPELHAHLFFGLPMVSKVRTCQELIVRQALIVR